MCTPPSVPGCVPQRAAPLRAVLRCAALALLCGTLARAGAHATRDRRAEMSPVPFVMGSRYGRSPERVMAPRNDRFFMGSRYGKRSSAAEDQAARGVWEGCEGGGASAQCRRLVCRYAGAPQLYKCVRTHGLQFNRRSAADTRTGDSDE